MLCRFIFFASLMHLFIFASLTGFANLQEMTLEEKIGEILVIPVCLERGVHHQKQILDYIQSNHIHNLIFMQGNKESQRQWIELFQKHSTKPILCVQDAEWGMGMRLEDGMIFPKNLTLGAIQDNHLIYQLGKEIAKECRSCGIHLNLAPVVDVNGNSLNPIIHMRSFGEDPENVATKALAFVKGLTEEAEFACAKHFPGHGDTSVDSHYSLPIINKNLEHLEKIELIPFKTLIEANIFSIMVGHLYFPLLENGNKIASSLSSSITQNLLRNHLQFSGFVFTDALNMRALTEEYSLPEIAIQAFKAGADFLLFAAEGTNPYFSELLEEEIPQVIEALKSSFLSGVLEETALNERVAKILKMRETLSTIIEPLHDNEFALNLKKTLYEEAITLVENPEKVLPLKTSDSIALVQLDNNLLFKEALEKYALTSLFNLSSVSIDDLLPYDTVIISVDQVNPKKDNFGLDLRFTHLLSTLESQGKKAILALFGSPYSLSFFPFSVAKIVAYENDPTAKTKAADSIFGAISPKGKLPVTILNHYPIGHGLNY